jgi:hypothetical protein
MEQEHQSGTRWCRKAKVRMLNGELRTCDCELINADYVVPARIQNRSVKKDELDKIAGVVRKRYQKGYIDIYNGEFHFWHDYVARSRVERDAGAARMAQLPPSDPLPAKPKVKRVRKPKEFKLENTRLEEEVAAMVGEPLGSDAWGKKLGEMTASYLRSRLNDPLGELSYPNENPILDQITYPVASRLYSFWVHKKKLRAAKSKGA